jgi:tetratricopeptide (TPR) repeat protein
MNRMLIVAVAALTMVGCAQVRDLTGRNQNPYDEAPFYAKYLNTGSAVDAEIQRLLVELRNNPQSPELHNALGAALVEKGFPKDASREFGRAIDADGRYFPAWYNLGLVRESMDDALGARRAFQKTVSVKPGHSAALFQLGLIEEKRQHTEKAVELFAKAYMINPSLLDVAVNPRVLDSSLTDLALLRMYDLQHSRKTMYLQGVPDLSPVGVAVSRSRSATTPPNAPSTQPNPASIVTPAPPATDPGVQQQNQARTGRRRPRNMPETPAEAGQQTEEVTPPPVR